MRQFDRLLPALVTTQNNEIQRLYQYLIRFAPQYKSAKVARASIQKALNWGDKKLTDRSSQLLQGLGQCLAVSELLSDPLEQQLRLMDIYENLELDKHYQSAKRQAQKALSNIKRRGPDFFIKQYKLNQLEARAQETYQRKHKPSLQAAADALDEFYLSSKLDYILEMTSAGSVLDIPYDIRHADAIKQWASQPPYLGSPLIDLYRVTLLLIEKPQEEEHFIQLRTLLEHHHAEIPEGILKHLYTYLLNHCTSQITKHGNAKFYQYYLDINTKLIDQGLILEEGLLLPWRYSNLITVGLRTGKLKWTRQFLDRYRSYLPSEDNENTYNYNLAHCLYYERKVDDALLLLLQLDLRDPLLAIAAKNLTAKIYWENDQLELLLNFLENYRLYIYRQQLAKSGLKKRVKNFIDFTRRLAKIPDFEPERRKELLSELPKPAEILEHEWLVKQLEL